MRSSPPPSREEASVRRQAVAHGEVAREVVSQRAERLMHAEFSTGPDVLVMQALQYLHGFDMTYRSDDRRLIGHGPPGEYVRTLGNVADLRMAQRVAASDDPGVPHNLVMSAMDALDAADHASRDEARRILAPHADLLTRAAQAEHLLTDHP